MWLAQGQVKAVRGRAKAIRHNRGRPGCARPRARREARENASGPLSLFNVSRRRVGIGADEEFRRLSAALAQR